MQSINEIYVNLLRTHDWAYEWSDDPGVYRRGANERNELYRMQVVIDEDYTIWNENAPEPFQRRLLNE